MEKAEKTSRRPFSLWMDWCDAAPPEVRRRYLKGFLLSLGAYMVVLVISLRVVHAFPEARWRYVVAVTPMVPMFFLLWVYLWYLRHIDELQRQIQLEGLGFAFAGTALITFGYGFLQTVGFPDVSWFMVWPIMGALWGIGHGIAARRFR
jgi:hypothetical protein